MEIRYVTIVRYLLYLNAIVILVMGFLVYADDYEDYKAERDPSTLQSLVNYSVLFLCVGAAASIYFFIYDQMMYKIGLFVLLLAIQQTLRIVFCINYRLLQNIQNITGLLLGIIFIWLVWNQRTDSLDIPIGKFINTKANVSNDGTTSSDSKIDKSRSNSNSKKARSKASTNSSSVSSSSSTLDENKTSKSWERENTFSNIFGSNKSKSSKKKKKKKNSSKESSKKSSKRRSKRRSKK